MKDTVLKALGSKTLLERKSSLMPRQRSSEQQARVQFPGLAFFQATSFIFVHLRFIA